jgi:hypothetical protein
VSVCVCVCVCVGGWVGVRACFGGGGGDSGGGGEGVFSADSFTA